MALRSALLVTSLLACTALGGASSYADTLAQAVSKVVNEHPQVELSKLEMAIASQDVEEVSSGHYPEISLVTSGGWAPFTSAWTARKGARL